MSIEATLATWKLSKKQVTATEKLFLLSCANRAGENHECWPSLKRLTADTGLDRKTIIKIRQSVIDKQLMEYTGAYVGSSKQIPIMRLTYVQNLEDRLDQNFTGTKIGTGPVFGTGTSTKIGTGTSTVFGTLNLKEETKRLITNLAISSEMSDDENLDDLEICPENNQALELVDNNQEVDNFNISNKSDYRNYRTNKCTEHSNLEHKVNHSNKSPKDPDKNILFKKFWDHYPIKKKKQEAYKMWCKINPDEAFTNELIEVLKNRMANDTEWREGYIPHAATYLNPNNRRWEDEVIDKGKLKKELIAKEGAKKRAIEVEQLAARRKQEEIESSAHFKQIVSQASENERRKLREMLGTRPPSIVRR